MGWFLLVLLMCCLAWRVVLAVRVGRDAHQRGLTIQASLGWALVALADARRYWWGARLNLLTDDEAQALLRHAAREHGLLHVTYVRCPLCGSKIADALTVAASGTLTTRARATCDRCDFRLDACRHCRHFLPGSTSLAVGTLVQDRGGDPTHGRCARYHDWQPVRETHPHMAQRLVAMGYECLRAPKRILDSYFPLAECTSFDLDLKRLRQSEIPWLTSQRIALVRLHEKLVGNQP
jgi:hypothetical protein